MTSWLPPEFFASMVSLCKRLQMNPHDLAAVLWAESGMRPNAVNRNKEGYPVAVGIFQLTSITNDATGLSEAERRNLITRSAMEQWPYGERYFVSVTKHFRKPPRPYLRVGEVYEAEFAPGYMRTPYDPEKIYYRGPSDAYEGNKQTDNFDLPGPKKGYITAGDMERFVYRVWDSAGYWDAIHRLYTDGGWTGEALTTAGPVVLRRPSASPTELGRLGEARRKAIRAGKIAATEPPPWPTAADVLTGTLPVPEEKKTANGSSIPTSVLVGAALSAAGLAWWMLGED